MSQKDLSVTGMLNSESRKLSKTFVAHLSIAMKVSRLYSGQHVNVDAAIGDLTETIQAIHKAEGELSLSRSGDYLFLNGVRVRVDAGGHESMQALVDHMTDRGVGEIAVDDGLDRADIETLLKVLSWPVDTDGVSFDKFQELALSKIELRSITFGPERQRREKGSEFSNEARLCAVQAFFGCCYATRQAFEAAKQNGRINVKRMKRSMQMLVDMIQAEEHLILALANVKGFATREANHAVNTAVLSVGIGAKLGLPKKILGDLGMAALLHDIGKSRHEDIEGISELDGDKREIYQRHVMEGPQVLLRQRMMDATVKSINVAFMHHYRFDGTGFPKLMHAQSQNLYTRIVAVCDRYDGLTTPRKYAEKALTPSEAMRHLLDNSGTEFDPLVVKAFVNLMGLYPVGCVVQLKSGATGTVAEPSSNPKYLDRPVVRVFLDSRGNPTEERIDLLEKGIDGTFQDAIECVCQQEDIQLELEDYLSVI